MSEKFLEKCAKWHDCFTSEGLDIIKIDSVLKDVS